MIPSTCPQCSEPVSVPEAAFDLDAQAQCPWCGEISPIRKLKRPPVVKIFDASGNPLPLTALTGPWVGDAATSPASESSHFTESESESLGIIDSQEETRLGDDGEDSIEPWSKGKDDEENLQPEDVPVFQEDIALANEISFEDESFDENKIALAQTPENLTQAPENIFADEKSFPDFSHQHESVDANKVVLDQDDLKLEDPVETPSGRPTPMRVRPAPHRPKPKSSPWKSIVGMALSPFLALGLAYVVFAAIGKVPNWGFWPFTGSSSVAVNRTAGAPMQMKPKPAKSVESKVPVFNGPSPLADLDAPPETGKPKEPITSEAQEIKPSIDLPAANQSSSKKTTAANPTESIEPVPEPKSTLPPQEKPEAVNAPAPVAEEPTSDTPPMESETTKADPPKVEPTKVDPPKVDPPKVDPTKVEPTKVEPTKVEPPKVESTKVEPAQADPPVEPAKVEKVDQPASDTNPEPTTATDNPPASNDAAPKVTSTVLVETPEIIDAAGIAQRMVKAIGNDSLEEEKRTVWTSKTYLQLCKVSSFEPQATPAIEALLGELRSSKMIDKLAEMGNRYYAESKDPDPYLFIVGQYNADDKSFTMRGGPTFQLADPDPALKSGEVLALGSVANRDQKNPIFSASVIEPISP